MIDGRQLAALASHGRVLTPEECAATARSAAELIDVRDHPIEAGRSYTLLWRTEHSEAWLNVQAEAERDTGFHDHSGSCVGVHVLVGRARNETLVLGGTRRIHEYGAGESFSLTGSGIHRMEHDLGTVTVHVYSPAISAIGHYDVLDGELHRTASRPDEGSPPSPGLAQVLGGAVR